MSIVPFLKTPQEKLAREILKKILSSIMTLALKKWGTNSLLKFLLTGMSGTIILALGISLFEGLGKLGVQLTLNKTFFDQVDSKTKEDLKFYNTQLTAAYQIVFSKDIIITDEIKDKTIAQIQLATDRLADMRRYIK